MYAFVCKAKGFNLGMPNGQLGDQMGASVTFFWPALNPAEVGVKAMPGVKNKKKLKRKRSSAKTQPKKDHQDTTERAHQATPEKKATSNSAVLTPITAHRSKQTVVNEQPSVVDLTSCDSVAYEMRDGTSGVKYTKNGTEAWTPVKKRRPRRKRKESQTPVLTGHNSTDSDMSVSTSNLSDSELDVSCSRMVQYSVRNGIPGCQYIAGMWIGNQSHLAPLLHEPVVEIRTSCSIMLWYCLYVCVFCVPAARSFWQTVSTQEELSQGPILWLLLLLSPNSYHL